MAIVKRLKEFWLSMGRMTSESESYYMSILILLNQDKIVNEPEWQHKEKKSTAFFSANG